MLEPDHVVAHHHAPASYAIARGGEDERVLDANRGDGLHLSQLEEVEPDRAQQGEARVLVRVRVSVRVRVRV
mgnify:CR=1 FL=1